MSWPLRDEEPERTAISELLSVLTQISSLQQQKYLAEWLLKLLNLSCYVQQNRREMLKVKGVINILAGKLFESVG